MKQTTDLPFSNQSKELIKGLVKFIQDTDKAFIIRQQRQMPQVQSEEPEKGGTPL